MVRFFCIIFIGILSISNTILAAPIVEASVNSLDSHSHYPIPVTVTITHKKEEKIDAKSFEMDGKSLEISFVKDVSMSSLDNTLISIYQFNLPAQEKGLYILPSISVKIGNQTFKTESSTYEVGSSKPLVNTKTYSDEAKAGPAIFRIEAFVNGPTSLYPKERTKLIYRISYNRSIDLSRSVLPMIHPEHFQKIGDVQIVDSQQGDLTVQELTQEVEAIDIGTFELGPSLIEGHAYRMERGQKVFDTTLLKAEAPVIKLEVKQFPHAIQPLSFTGAIGQIKVEAKLLSTSIVYVGDIIQLQVVIEGVNNIEELTFPSLACQPGFSGFFQISDLPPVAEIRGKTKVFLIEIRPLTSLINEIPSIEISSFDQNENQYVTQKTAPIQMNIHTYATKKQSNLALVPVLAKIPNYEKWAIPPAVKLELTDVQLPSLSTSSRKKIPIFWVIVLAFAVLMLQKYWQNKLK